jgi:hypothetical protein
MAANIRRTCPAHASTARRRRAFRCGSPAAGVRPNRAFPAPHRAAGGIGIFNGLFYGPEL